MPDFTVQIQRTLTYLTNVTISAKDEDAADTKANALADNYEALTKAMKAEKAEWDLDDETYEVLDISEE